MTRLAVIRLVTTYFVYTNLFLFQRSYVLFKNIELKMPNANSLYFITDHSVLDNFINYKLTEQRRGLMGSKKSIRQIPVF